MDERGNQPLETATGDCRRQTGDFAIYRVREIGKGNWSKISRALRRANLRPHSAATSVRRFALAQNSSRKATSRECDAQNRAPPGHKTDCATVPHGTMATTLNLSLFLCTRCAICAKVCR